MSIHTRTIYQSSNGDRWQLAHDRVTGRVFVVHQANPSSGGCITQIELAAFLETGARSPEHQELLRLIGTLVDEAAGMRGTGCYTGTASSADRTPEGFGHLPG